MNLKEFSNPPKQYRPLPLWEWNADIESSEVETQVRDLYKKGFGGFFIHAANGLKTKYLGDDWMKVFRRAIEVAGELKIEAWFCDDDRNSSGQAGGTTTFERDDLVQTFLVWEPEADKADKKALDNTVVFVIRNSSNMMVSTPDRPENLTGTGVFYTKKEMIFSPGLNGGNYPDLMNPEAVQVFIENTYEKYLKLFRYDFGEYFPGVLTNISSEVYNTENEKSHILWSEKLPEYFEKSFGYSLTENLHLLISDNDNFKFRNDFYRAINGLFAESFTKTIQSWCKEKGLMLAGLFEKNLYLNPLSQYKNTDILQIEIPCQINNDLVKIKELRGMANQLGKKRVIGKILSNAGNALTFDEIRRTVDYISALGVNSISPVNMRYSLLGVSKEDNSISLSYHHPGWEKIRSLADYSARCSWAVSQGKSAARVVLLSPLESSSSIVIGEEHGTKETENIYSSIVKKLIAEQLDFDICQESVLAEYAITAEDKLFVENTTYDCIIVPPSISWQNTTIELLESFNGTIIFIESPSVKIKDNTDLTGLFSKENFLKVPFETAVIMETIQQKFPISVCVTTKDGIKSDNVLINHRFEAAAHIVFVASPESEESQEITILIKALGGAVELDPASGRAYRYASEIKDGKTIINTVIPPFGSKIFLIDQTQTSVVPDYIPNEETSFLIECPYSYKALTDNCLTIDRCSLHMDGRQVAENKPVSTVKKLIWEKTGLSDFMGYQPWALKENNIRTRTNKTVLTYSFTVKNKPGTIALAMETSDRFTVEINGNKIDFTPGRWFIDRRFRVLNMEDHIIEGENIIKATTDFLWDTEIENVYIIGDFAVGTKEDGYPVIKTPEKLTEGDWGLQGFPFYAGSMLYKMSFTIEKDPDAKYEFDISGIKSSVTGIRVNDEEVGIIPFSPLKGDITGALKNGENHLELEISGSNANIFNSSSIIDENEARRFVQYGIISSPRLIVLK